MSGAMSEKNMGDAAKEYGNDGVTLLQHVIPSVLVRSMRREIMEVVEEVCGGSTGGPDDPQMFVTSSTELLWEAISREPHKRNLLYTYVQRVPTIYQLASADILRCFAKAISMRKPSVREAKVQIFLPWEKLFLQDCHQDINSLDSTNSVTFWIPLHSLTERTAVRYWVGSHKEGPVPHEEIVDEAEAIYLERVPTHLQAKYPVVRSAVAADGDVIAINRLVFHQSPRFEDQLYARWSVVVRYDDIAGQGLYLNAPKYAHLAPNSEDKMQGRLDNIRAFLARKPKGDWREKLQGAQSSHV